MTLEQRIQDLERSLRRFKLLSGISLGAVALAAALGFQAAQKPADIVARSVSVVDEDGKTLSGLTSTGKLYLTDYLQIAEGPDGPVRVNLGYVSAPNKAVSLQLKSEGAKCEVAIDDQTARVSMSADDNRQLSMRVFRRSASKSLSSSIDSYNSGPPRVVLEHTEK